MILLKVGSRRHHVSNQLNVNGQVSGCRTLGNALLFSGRKLVDGDALAELLKGVCKDSGSP
jgi:hypothetical protein